MKSIIYFKNNIWLLILAFGLVMPACKKSAKSDLKLNSDAEMTSFTANGIKGTINDTTHVINVVLPFGSDITKVKPNIVLPEGAVVTPASGELIDMSLPVSYQVINGSIYNNYTVRASVQTAFTSFKIDTTAGVVNDIAHTITVTMPPGSIVTNLAPSITLSPGLTISPAIGTAEDFTKPVTYTVTSSVASVAYKVTVTVQTAIPYIAFIGTAETVSGITNPEEAAAVNWLLANYKNAEYISFNSVNNGSVSLSKYKVVWWHYETSQTLPDVSNYSNVITYMKAYYAAGGNFFFTGFAPGYLTVLGIVPSNHGLNNVFGGPPPSIDPNNDWGISFAGNTNNPLFQGLTLSSTSSSTAYLLGKGTERENNTAQWKVSDWGGYTNTAGWEAATGGIALASTDGSTTDNTVNIAEFPSVNKSGKTIEFGLGAYVWYNEPDATTGTPSIPNVYLPNIKQLTANALSILTQ